MVERQPSKLHTRVRFPSPAPLLPLFPDYYSLEKRRISAAIFTHMKKWIVRLVIIFAVLFIVGLVAAFAFLNNIVKTGVEKVGPIITKTEVKLESANISPFSGSGQLKGMFVGNPEGYKTPSAAKVGDIKVAVDVKSLLSPVVVVDSISIQGAEVTLEVGLTGNNLSKLLDNVSSVAAADEGTKKPEEKPAEGGKKFKVKDIVITGTKVNGSVTAMGGQAVTFPIPEIHLTNIGTDSDGVSAAELTKKILSEITVASVKEFGKAGGAVGDQLKNLGKGTGSQVEKASKGLKKLFGK